MTGTATAPTFDPFFSPDLLATRDPQTANLCAQTWQAKLEMGLLSAHQLAQDLHADTARGSPREETIIALYNKLTSLTATHPARENIVRNGRAIIAPENTLGQPLADATKAVEGWYVDCVNASKHYPDRPEKRPTVEGVQAVCDTLKNILTLDLQTIARPHIDRYNGACKPSQMFTTPVELYGRGAPLEWQTGKVTDVKPYQVFDTPVELYDAKGPLAWQRGGKN